MSTRADLLALEASRALVARRDE